MGDVAMLPHALRALMSAYPGLRVTVATRPMFKPFFEGLGVDFLDVDLKGAHHSLRGMWRLAAEARWLVWMPWPTCTTCCVPVPSASR